MPAEHLQIAAYLRVWQGKTLLVVCNFSDQARHFEAPVADAPASGWQLLLGNSPADSAALDVAAKPLCPTCQLLRCGSTKLGFALVFESDR